MGFLGRFKSTESVIGHCFICNAPIVVKVDQNGVPKNKPKYALMDNKYICPVCAFEKGIKNKHIDEKSSSELIALFKQAGLTTPNEFSPSKRVIRTSAAFGDSNPLTLLYSYIEIDESRQLINLPAVKTHMFGKGEFSENIHAVAELIDFELLDSGQRIVDSSSLAGAALGGMAFGGAGAIVGSTMRSKKIKDECTSLSLKLIFNSINNNTEYIYFIGGDSDIMKVKRDSAAFKVIYGAAQECLSILTILLKQQEQVTAIASSKTTSSSDVIESIKKLAELKNVGILTQEEFDKKKTELMSKI